jgi:hypothetical protein
MPCRASDRSRAARYVGSGRPGNKFIVAHRPVAEQCRALREPFLCQMVKKMSARLTPFRPSAADRECAHPPCTCERRLTSAAITSARPRPARRSERRNGPSASRVSDSPAQRGAEQAGHRTVDPVRGDQLGALVGCLPFALAAGDKDHRARLVGKSVECALDRRVAAAPFRSSRARIASTADVTRSVGQWHRVPGTWR